MKKIDELMKLPYRVVIEPDIYEGGYVASVPDLPGLVTCADNIEDLFKNIEDAKYAWFSEALENKVEINEPSTIDKYSGQFKLRIPKSLHKQLAEEAKREGISMNQYCLYLLSRGA